MLPKIGDIFDDRYEIEETLGSGGIGTVFRAMQLDCRRTVALKILQEHAAMDDESRERFVRESRTLGKLSHANIVTVYHLAVSANAVPYLVMEYVEGKSIQALMGSTGRLPVLQSLKIIRDTARAMLFVHKRDIIHRDLKPGNIILTQVPDPDTIKIVDFGLAGLQNQQNQNTRLTCTGEIIGTAAYMSPEQCQGKALDFRTDIYSLTACLYRMIVGRAPFECDGAFKLMYKHIHETVPTIDSSQVDLFDPMLNEIVSRGMSKDPQQRFGSMDEMASKLDETISLLESAGRRSSGKPTWPAAFVLVLFCVLLPCCAVFIWKQNESHKKLHPNASKERPQALTELHQTEARKYKRDGMLKPASAFKNANPSHASDRLVESSQPSQRFLEIRQRFDEAVARQDSRSYLSGKFFMADSYSSDTSTRARSR